VVNCRKPDYGETTDISEEEGSLRKLVSVAEELLALVQRLKCKREKPEMTQLSLECEAVLEREEMSIL
jgi:hypothetical protein